MTSLPPYQVSSASSADGALKIKPHVSRMRRIILHLLQDASDGLTREEIQLATRFKTSSVCGRVNELIHLKHITVKRDEHGHKCTRRSRSGVNVEVLIANPPQ